MIKTVFFYKSNQAFEHALYSLSRCNTVRRLFVIDSRKVSDSTGFWTKCRNNEYILQPNNVYIAIEYINYRMDPFFYYTITDIEAQSIQTTYRINRIVNIAPCTICVDILFPFMPKREILNNLGVFTVATNKNKRGLYTVTFVRKYDGHLDNLLDGIRNNVESFLPNVPIMVTALYRADWFSKQQ